ncbi:AP-3 complex subunit delta-1 isoform X1 [Schistocerca nitens]|uniref:AP-3 complex subunit delta-1 isoform X1 n=1 Tax=Schistocerca nitens TaxID=7011 RepID=UPI0021195C21|nr:AP-3 complex subunit delta-1 isoform X1 [Schistocerca nitens]XP_049804899.1 AP-3 complex subunit delta-1 isoform X1 [Schistocerca nitens]
MALRKVKGNLERMFDKNLTDLVRGIRNNKDNEAKYIAQCIEEIKQELRQDNIAVKANAVAKLTYLQMLGYDISWAGFNIIEVMSSSKFTYKRIGYLASSQCFHADTELLMLTTNMIRKDLNSQNQYDAGVALSALSCFINADLSRDLANDIMTLLTSTKSYLRKKAVLMMYKVFLKFPEALRPAFPRLKEKLEDTDSGVQSAAVNVVCELARKNPKNYLSLAPVFFKLMTTSTNNWMLIKIIKLFGALTPLEPRLGKKLIEPLTNLIHSTSAMSLLYECINTVIAVLISISSGMPNHSASIQLCVQKLRILIEDSDQNLKYLGLLAMSKILKTHPKSVQAHKDLIMQCLDDKDESIRLRALDLLYGMVSKKNLMEIVKKLMIHMDKAEGTTYRDELLSKIIQICSQNNYQYITNFEWYVSVLVELTRMEGSQHGSLVSSQMLDVAIRVQAIRPFAVQQMELLLENAHFLTSGTGQSSTMAEVLTAAAWICGEFPEYLRDQQSTLEAMIRSRVFGLPGHIQAVYVQNILKLFASIFVQAEQKKDVERISKVCKMIASNLPQFVSSADLEVQERSSSALQLVLYIEKLVNKGDLDIAGEVAALFIGELNPVAPKAQRKVQVPDGLDLDVWINDPPSESSGSGDDENDEGFVKVTDIFVKSDNLSESYTKVIRPQKEPTEEELQKSRRARKLEQENNPHYLKPRKSSIGKKTDELLDIPVAQLDIPVTLRVPGLASPDKYIMKNSKTHSRKKKKMSKGKKRLSSEEEDLSHPVHLVNTDKGEMPEGAQSSEDDTDTRPNDDPHRALDINLDEPLREDETLAVPHSHSASNVSTKKDSNDLSKKKSVKTEEAKTVKKSKKGSKSGVKKKKSGRRHPKEAVEDESTTADMLTLDEHLDKPLVEPFTTNPTSGLLLESEGKLITTEANGKEPSTKKEKKKAKDGKKSKRKVISKLKEGYEEASGISTPSKEVVTEQSSSAITGGSGTEINPPFSCLSSFSRLASDNSVEMVYGTSLCETDEVAITVVLKNQSPSLLKEFCFSVSNTSLVKLIKPELNDDYGLNLNLTLPPSGSTELQLFFRVLSVDQSHKLRGTLTYMVQSSDDMSSHEKLDFWVNIPCSTFMIARVCGADTVSDLLTSGQLPYHNSFHLKNIMQDTAQMISQICFHCNFVLVEQIENTASLYSRSVDGSHICLLLKVDRSCTAISVDGKSDNEVLLSNIISEIEKLLQPGS